MTADGDCYEVAGRLIIAEADDRLELVHATVVGPGTPRHGHAGVEGTTDIGGFPLRLCIDKSNGNDVALPADGYYRLGQVEDVRRYTREEALVLMLRTRHFGPWEEEPGA